MARVKINFPDKEPLFTTSLTVRITDINYGNHLANDALLRIAHEARMQWLQSAGLSELDSGGHGLIMADAAIAFKSEAFFGEQLDVVVYVDEITKFSFDLLYRISCVRNEKNEPVAHIKTGMVCFDYGMRKPTELGEKLKKIFS